MALILSLDAPIYFYWLEPTTIRRKLSAVSAKESAHTAHASQEAIRVLIPPSLPCSCFLVPSVTTPLYSTTVSQALRLTLRGKGLTILTRTSYPRVRGGHRGWGGERYKSAHQFQCKW